MPLTVSWPVSGPYCVPVIVSEWNQNVLALGVLAMCLDRRHLGQDSVRNTGDSRKGAAGVNSLHRALKPSVVSHGGRGSSLVL